MEVVKSFLNGILLFSSSGPKCSIMFTVWEKLISWTWTNRGSEIYRLNTASKMYFSLQFTSSNFRLCCCCCCYYINPPCIINIIHYAKCFVVYALMLCFCVIFDEGGLSLLIYFRYKIGETAFSYYIHPHAHSNVTLSSVDLISWFTMVIFFQLCCFL